MKHVVKTFLAVTIAWCVLLLPLWLRLFSLFCLLEAFSSLAHAGLLDSVIQGGIGGLAGGPWGAVAGVAGGLISGIFGNRSANAAAKAQAAAAAKAKQDIIDRTAQVNNELTTTARTVGEQARTAAGDSTARVEAATGNANALLDPYRQTGEHANTLLDSALDDSGKMPTLDQIQIDPGYEFRRKQGQDFLLSRAAGLGLGTSGGTVKSAINYNQEAGSQEFEKAFARFTTQRQQNIDNLRGIAGAGQAAAGTEGSNLLASGKYGADLNYNSTTYAGDKNFGAVSKAGDNTLDATRAGAELDTQGANALAAGKVAGSNAITNGIGMGVNAITSAATLDKILKNPAAKYRTLGLPTGTLDRGVAA